MNPSHDKDLQATPDGPKDTDGLRIFFEANPQPMWIYDLETLAFLAVNDAAVAHYGYSRAEFLGMTLRDIRPPADIPALLDNIAHVSDGLDEAGVWHHCTKDGRNILVEITAHTLEYAGCRAEMVLAHDITRRVESEQALNRALGEVEQVLAVAGAIILVLDLAGRVVRINPFGCTLLGRDAADILGHDWFAEFLPPRLRDELHTIHRQLAGGDPQAPAFHDNLVLTANGDERLISWHNAPLYDEQGRVTGVLSSGQDVTERQRHTEALHRYERIVASAPDHIAMLDRDYIYRVVNDTYARLYRKPREAIVGHSMAEVLGQPTFDELAKNQLDRCLAGEVVCDQSWLPFPQGERRYMDVSYTPYREPDGRVGGVVVGARDITELKLAEANLHASEERLRIILETAADAILALDEHSHVVFANPASARLLGYELDALQQRPITDLMPERFRAPHQAGFARYLHNGSPTMPWQGIALTVLHRDGHEIPVDVSFGEQRLENGRLFIGIIRDVSERRRAEDALRASEHKYRTLVEFLPLRVFQKDLESVYISCNAAFAGFVGTTTENIAGHTDDDFFPPELARKYRSDDRRIMTAGRPEEFDEDFIEHGEIRTALTTKAPVRDENGRVTGVLGIFSDITERIRTEAQLRQAAVVFESTIEGVTITDAEGNIIAVNRAFCEITGYTAAEVLGRNPRLLKSGRHDQEFYQTMWAAITRSGNWRGELWNRRKNGELYPEWLTISSVRDAQQQLVNYVGVFSDISHIKRSEAQLERLTLYDALTELPNRLLFNSRLEHALERARHQGGRVAVLYLDMDRFKTVNDSLGHPSGDELLVAIARRLAGSLHKDDTLGRLGGDEFVILLEGLKHGEDAATVTLKMLHALERPFQIGGQHEVYIAASVGVSLFPDDASDATRLLRNADAALNQAKEQGRNTYRFYTESMTRAAGDRLNLEARLRRALERGEFLLHYQPQIRVSDGASVGVEALVRWQHPEDGLISPAQFIPLAEETGLIVPLGEWVLFTACAQMKEWLDLGLPAMTLAVNLSPRQFRQTGLTQQVHAILDATELPPHLLELEITESAIMEQGREAVAVMDALKALGVRLAIDDFGTGYSSLAYLKRFPVDKLKIDQSFIRDIPQDRDDMMIAAAIISMAHSLRLEVLAEGVETEAQLDFLRAHNGDSFQGFLFSRPRPAAEVLPLLTNGHKGQPPGTG